MPETSKSCEKMRDFTKKYFHLYSSAVYNSFAKKKLMNAHKALMILCSDDYSCSDITSSSDEEDNCEKSSQNSSQSNDENEWYKNEIDIIPQSPKKMKIQSACVKIKRSST